MSLQRGVVRATKIITFCSLVLGCCQAATCASGYSKAEWKARRIAQKLFRLDLMIWSASSVCSARERDSLGELNLYIGEDSELDNKYIMRPQIAQCASRVNKELKIKAKALFLRHNKVLGYYIQDLAYGTFLKDGNHFWSTYLMLDWFRDLVVKENSTFTAVLNQFDDAITEDKICTEAQEKALSVFEKWSENEFDQRIKELSLFIKEYTAEIRAIHSRSRAYLDALLPSGAGISLGYRGGQVIIAGPFAEDNLQ